MPTIAERLRQHAVQYAGVEEGVACAGTSLEKVTVKVRGKAFLFLSQKDAMVKLGQSLPSASELAAKDPDQCKAGAGGWVKVTFGGKAIPLALLKKWVAESYELMAGAKSLAKTSKAHKEPS